MRRSRFTAEQIIGILGEQETGVPTAEVCRKHGISQATFYAWKAKYGGMSVSDATRLKQLEAESTKLKKLLVEAMLDKRRRATTAWAACHDDSAADQVVEVVTLCGGHRGRRAPNPRQ